MTRKVHGLYCEKCDVFVVSWYRHHMHWCPCGAVAIDGGQDDYFRVIGSPPYSMVSIELEDKFEPKPNNISLKTARK